MRRPPRSSAIAIASAIVALVVTSDSVRPRWTIVCAICGRIPLMTQSAPISRAAATVFRRCCATSVSTVGTPVISMIAIVEFVSTIRSSRLSITTCARSLSSVPINGSATTPSQSFTTGVESSISSRCWRLISASRSRWCSWIVNNPSRSRRAARLPDHLDETARIIAELLRQASE